jgi:tRNA(Arg) A34 adenosine deaminase TadA
MKMLTHKQSKIVDTLFMLASDHEATGNAKIVAAVVYKNQIISYGFNQLKSHPFIIPYQKNEDAIYLHAETDAIKNALKRITVDQLSKCDLFIIRAKQKSSTSNKIVYGIAKPCDGCAKCISTFGLKKVYYSTNEQDIKSM